MGATGPGPAVEHLMHERWSGSHVFWVYEGLFLLACGWFHKCHKYLLQNFNFRMALIGCLCGPSWPLWHFKISAGSGPMGFEHVQHPEANIRSSKNTSRAKPDRAGGNNAQCFPIASIQKFGNGCCGHLSGRCSSIDFTVDVLCLVRKFCGRLLRVEDILHHLIYPLPEQLVSGILHPMYHSLPL